VVVRRAKLLLPPLACSLAALAVASCGTFTFHSPVPHTAADPDLEVSVDTLVSTKYLGIAIEEHQGVRVVADVTARPGASFGAPSLTANARPPCSRGGVRARTDVVFAAAVPDAATRTVMLNFSGPAAEQAGLFVNQDTVLDLPVFPADHSQPARCLRLPLETLQSGTEWRATPYMMGLELRLFDLIRPLPNYGNFGLLIALPQGTWIRGWRVSAGFEGGFIGERGVTNPTPSQGKPIVGLLGGALEVGHLIYRGGGLGLDAQLGYDLLGTVGPDAQRSPAEAAAYRASALHGPRLALRLLGLTGGVPWRGFAAPADTWAFGLAAFAGFWWQGFQSATPAPFAGLSLEGNVGL
jgi:hypothetical protein